MKCKINLSKQERCLLHGMNEMKKTSYDNNMHKATWNNNRMQGNKKYQAMDRALIADPPVPFRRSAG